MTDAIFMILAGLIAALLAALVWLGWDDARSIP